MQSLIDIAELISAKPQLQTEQVSSILKSCVLHATSFKDMLERHLVEKNGSLIRKWAKAVGGAVVEKMTLESMQELEVDKSVLVLCITSIDA